MKFIQQIKNRFSILFPVLFVLVGIYFFYNIYFREHAPFAMILFFIATISMTGIIRVWQWFTPKYAPRIIYWTTAHRWVRKIIAGGSFSYYEYNPNPDKIGLFEPIGRFANLMIAFLGVATTIANALGFHPENPVSSANSVYMWMFLLFAVPIILTPIIPIIWAMEDMKLKAWNAKHGETWRVSVKYKRRFNSFIAIGSVSVGLTVTINQAAESTPILDSIGTYLNILLYGVVLLMYPVGVLTLLYYWHFSRGRFKTEVQDLMGLDTAITELKIVDPRTGLSMEEMKEQQIKEPEMDLEEKDPDSPEKQVLDEPEQGIFKKIGEGVGKGVTTITNPFTTPFKKRKSKKLAEKSQKVKEKRKKKRTGGSATAGLWDKDEE